MKIKPIIKVNGRPLRNAYVEHLVFGLGQDKMYMTDKEGRVRNINFDEGIDNLTSRCDIRIICQNPIVRVLNGKQANLGVYEDQNVADGQTIDLAWSRQWDWYEILNLTSLAYELVFQPLTFFRSKSHSQFPLGRKSTLRATRDRAERIELSYPDKLPQELAFVEPSRLVDGYPLMHIKDRTEDGRLFGERDQIGRQEPTLIPHELTHALHFSTLTKAKRESVSGRYTDFLLGDFLSGGDSTHNLGKRTTAEVAYIEAGGNFGEEFMQFVRRQQGVTSTLVRPERTPITAALQQQFVFAQYDSLTTQDDRPLVRWNDPTIRNPPPLDTGLRPLDLNGPPADRHTQRHPRFTGGDREGAVYGAIFTDFARVVGLDVAASAYFAANALTFGEYRDFIHRTMPQHDGELESARDFWGL